MQRPWARYIPALTSLLLLLPLAFSSPGSPTVWRFGLPRVLTGDEPHYLLLINSALRDGDLDLANNYAAVHRGGEQAGLRFVGSPLDHHTVWFENGVRRTWAGTYERDGERWDRDGDGHPVPRVRADADPPAAGHPEYSTHPPGLAFLLALVLFPFRGSQFIEPLALCCSAIAVVVAMFMFRALLKKYLANPVQVDLIAAVTFLATPAWHYGRTLFTEPYLLLCAIGAYSLALRGKSALLAGTFIAVGTLMKPPIALILIPLLVMYIADGQLKRALLFVSPVAVAVALFLWLNVSMFGSPWLASQAWLKGSILVGAIGMLFSLQFGYLFVAPAIILAIVVWPGFIRAHRRDAIVLASAIGILYLFYASFGSWNGATAYGARHIVPLIPLIFVSLVALPEMQLSQRPALRTAGVAICLLSIVINASAALPYWRYWDSNLIYAAIVKRN